MHRRLRIAQVAPLTESVPPKLYGGTERVVATLTEELVRQGHSVTLFASGDSDTSAHLVSPCPIALRLSGITDRVAAHTLMVEMLAQRAHQFDIVHFHIEPMHFSLARRLPCRHVTTLHGRLDLPHIVPLFSEFSDLPLVSVSNAQRGPLPSQNWVATIYHGLRERELPFRPMSGQYLAFLGRISPEKGVERAIAIAQACGMPLKIAAKVDVADRSYFKHEIAPLLSHPLIEFLGEIDDTQKGAFLGQAQALLFPIDWPEPFGLVMIESLACGTPVVAFRGGSVAEVIDDGVTGFVVNTLDEAIAATRRVRTLDRRVCRHQFMSRFGAARMASDYLNLYDRLLSSGVPTGSGSRRGD